MVSSPTRPLSLQERRRWRILCPTIHRRGALCGSSADWRPHLSSSGRGRHRDAPYEDVLGQMVTIREGGTERRVLADEAFLLQLAKRGVEGDSAARASLAVIEEARERQGIGECPISAGAEREARTAPAGMRFESTEGSHNCCQKSNYLA